MGSLLSSMPGHRREGKKKRKNNKKAYPPRRKKSSSSSSSSSSPSRLRRRGHQRLQQSRSSSASSFEKEVLKGNVKSKTAKYEQIDQKSLQKFTARQKKSSNRRSKPEERLDESHVNELEYLVRNKNISSQPERIVTVELDIPFHTDQKDRALRPIQINTTPLPGRDTMNKRAFEDECIEAHNEYRKCHGADPIVRDPKLTAMAQEWANKIAKKGKLEHSHNKGFGENVAFSSKKSPTGQEMCKMWYDEIKDYNFGKPGFAGNTGHFSQVVWKGSTHVGIGVTVGPKGTFVVANYCPAGNITNPGFFKENVGKQKSKPNIVIPHRRSSSSSSSSDDDRRLKHNKKSAAPGKKPKPGKKVETKTETYTENGVRKKKTTVTTTIVTVTPEGTKTSTSTETKIETLPDNSVPQRLKKLHVHDHSSSSSSSSSSDDESDTLSELQKRKFRRECLDRHNDLRRRHGAPKLQQSSTLQDAAQRHANKMLRQGKLSHSSKHEYGENVAMKLPMPTGAQACDMWYNEKKDYNFRKSVFSGNTGHFTQVVWEGTTEIGIGVASNSDGKTYVACFYNPPGNVRGGFEKNVKRDK